MTINFTGQTKRFGFRILASLSLLLASGVLIACDPDNTANEGADSVYLNGKIYTVNAAQPWAEAMAVRDGKLIENAVGLVTLQIPSYENDVYAKAIGWAVGVLNQYGITSVQEASANRRALAILNNLDEKGELSLRISAHLVWQNEQ